MRLIHMTATSTDPYKNLALEGYLLDMAAGTGDMVVYLWQNADTVVIGRNQNAYAECDIKRAHGQGISIARRKTGGGAVFHDLGNLNFSFIYPKEMYDVKTSLEVIARAMSSLGFSPEITGRNDLTIDGYKFSGNAYHSNGTVAMHHGTIMLDVDLKKMASILTTSRSKLSKRGIQSVHSRVINLKELDASVSMDDLKEAVSDAFVRVYNDKIEEILYDIDIDHERWEEISAEFASDDWIFGEMKGCELSKTRLFQWGEITVGITVDGTDSERISLFSDSLYPSLILDIEERLNRPDKDWGGYEDRYMQSIYKDVCSVYDELVKEIG